MHLNKLLNSIVLFLFSRTSYVIKAYKDDLKDFCLICSLTHRAHIASTLKVSKDIFFEFTESPPKHIALHWEGKLTEDRLGNKFEALSVIASISPNYINGKLFGVQRLYKASCNAQAKASFELLRMRKLQDAFKALVFVTSSSNSGWKSGGTKLQKHLMAKKHFYLDCDTAYMNW